MTSCSNEGKNEFQISKAHISWSASRGQRGFKNHDLLDHAMKNETFISY
jgi:hypothetical protein